MTSFNRSGHAVTADDLLPLVQRRGKLRGQGRWKWWLPEATGKAAFAHFRVSARQTARDMKKSHHHVLQAKHVVAHAIDEGQAKGLRRLRTLSEQKPFKFWITNNMFDETKLPLMIKKKGKRKWSTIASHAQVTWCDDEGEHDADVIRKPKCVKTCSAATQWPVIGEPPDASGIVANGHTPEAEYHGSLTSSDGGAVNVLCLKYAREKMDEKHLLLSNLCLQHKTGKTADALTEKLGLQTALFCVFNTFDQGDFFEDLRELAHEDIDDMEIVDPATFHLEPGDTTEAFTDALLDTCYVRPNSHRPDPHAGTGHRPDSRQVTAERFKKFFPYGWNRGDGGGWTHTTPDDIYARATCTALHDICISSHTIHMQIYRNIYIYIYIYIIHI